MRALCFLRAGVTSGWFARLPSNMQRLTHPGSLGHFTPGIFLGALMLIIEAEAASDQWLELSSARNLEMRRSHLSEPADLFSPLTPVLAVSLPQPNREYAVELSQEQRAPGTSPSRAG